MTGKQKTCENCGKAFAPADGLIEGLCKECSIKVVTVSTIEAALKGLPDPRELADALNDLPGGPLKAGANMDFACLLDSLRRSFNTKPLPLHMAKWADDYAERVKQQLKEKGLDTQPLPPEFYWTLLHSLFKNLIKSLKEIDRLREERELEQFPRAPDRMTGVFSAGIATTKGILIPVESKSDMRVKLSWVTLRTTQAIKAREINWLLPLDNTAKIQNILAWLDTAATDKNASDRAKQLLKDLDQEGITKLAKEFQAKASKEMAKILSPRGLCLYRSIQREFYHSKIEGAYYEKPGLGVDFFCDETRMLNMLYPGKRPKKEEFYKLLDRMTSGLMDITITHLIQVGKDEVVIKTTGPLYQKIQEIEVTRIPEGRREEAETRRGVWLHMSDGARKIFSYGDTGWHTWTDTLLYSMDTGVKKQYGLQSQDWIDEQLHIGWSNHQGKQSWSLNTILDDINLKNQYLYTDGDSSRKPRPGYRRNDWIRKFFRELLWIYNSKRKRGLWKTALLRDPDIKNSHYQTIPHFLEYLNTPEGKQALKKTKINHAGDPITGALRFIFQVEIGPKHGLNKRIRITDEDRAKRIADGRRKKRAKKCTTP